MKTPKQITRDWFAANGITNPPQEAVDQCLEIYNEMTKSMFPKKECNK